MLSSVRRNPECAHAERSNVAGNLDQVGGTLALSNPDLHDQVLAEARLTRLVAFKVGAKVLGVGVLDFLLVRIWAPNLVNQHQDLALAASIGCLLIALAATVWLAFQLWFDLRRFAEARRRIGRVHILKVGNR